MNALGNPSWLTGVLECPSSRIRIKKDHIALQLIKAISCLRPVNINNKINITPRPVSHSLYGFRSGILSSSRFPRTGGVEGARLAGHVGFPTIWWRPEFVPITHYRYDGTIHALIRRDLILITTKLLKSQKPSALLSGILPKAR